MKKSTAKSDVGIVGTWNAGQNGGPMLWVDHILNHYYLTLNAGSFNYVDSGQGPVVGQWQHIAATYDGATARVFVNGTQVASQAFTANVGDSGNWRIGAYGSTPTGFFEGLIDEVRIYDRRADGRPVQADMNAPVAAGPAVIATTPDNGAADAGAAPAIEARFNEAMSAASITASTFQLRNGSGGLVPATVTYDAGDRNGLARRQRRAQLRRDVHGDGQGRRERRQGRRRRPDGVRPRRGRSPSRRSPRSCSSPPRRGRSAPTAERSSRPRAWPRTPRSTSRSSPPPR